MPVGEKPENIGGTQEVIHEAHTKDGKKEMQKGGEKGFRIESPGRMTQPNTTTEEGSEWLMGHKCPMGKETGEGEKGT